MHVKESGRGPQIEDGQLVAFLFRDLGDARLLRGAGHFCRRVF